MAGREGGRGLTRWRWAAVAAVVVACDQATKWWAVGALTDAFVAGDGPLAWPERLQRFLWRRHPARSGAVELVEGFWHHRYVENPGAAWGFLSQVQGAWRTPMFVIISLVSMVVIAAMVRRTQADQHLVRWGFALVFGGAVGNFLDRVRLGYVIDFIDWHLRDGFAWPTFNLADAAISTGVGLLLLDAARQGSGARRRPSE